MPTCTTSPEQLLRAAGATRRDVGPRREVELWTLDLRQPIDVAPTEAERVRAAELRAPDVARRFLARRGGLRAVLAAQLDCHPAAVRIEVTCRRCGGRDHGKPRLARASSSIQLSVSHAQDVALIAIAPGRDVGVDLERVRAVRDVDRRARRLCRAEEARWLRSLPDARRPEALLRLWTHKEAYGKALGLGVAGALRCSIDLAREPAARLRAAPSAPGLDPASWWLDDLPLPQGFVGAICLAGPQVQSDP